MPGIPAKYLETFARLRRATDQLHRLMESGEFYAYGYLKRRKLVRRVRRLYGKLVGPVSPAVIGSAITAAGVLALTGCFSPNGGPPTATITPDFVLRDASTIGLNFTDNEGYHGGSYLVLADVDGDGNLDLYYSETYDGEGQWGAISRQRGDGEGGFEAHSSGSRDQYGLIGQYYDGAYWWVKPLTFVDMDGDGDLDLIASGHYRQYGDYEANYANLFLIRNEQVQESASVPTFDRPLPFATYSGVPDGYGISAGQFADLDGDGDLDLITVTYDGGVYLTPNTSNNEHVFTFQSDSTVRFPLAYNDFPYQHLSGLAITDIDNDGDQDILLSGYAEYDSTDNWIALIKNTSTAEGVSFAGPVFDPYGLTLPPIDRSNSHAYPPNSIAAGDIDGDGDVDVIVGTYATGVAFEYWDTTFYYFENTALP